jgi:hypothetical protein
MDRQAKFLDNCLDWLCRKPSYRPKGARSVGRRCIVAPTPGRLHCSATTLPCNGCNDCNDATILGQTGTDADWQRHRCNRCIVASLHATMQRSIVARHDATIRGTDSDNLAWQQTQPARPRTGVFDKAGRTGSVENHDRGWPGLSLRSPGTGHRGFVDSAPATP